MINSSFIPTRKKYPTHISLLLQYILFKKVNFSLSILIVVEFIVSTSLLTQYFGGRIAMWQKNYLFGATETKLHCSKAYRQDGDLQDQELARKRAGIEGIASVLRRRYKIDHLPVRGRSTCKGLHRV